MYNFKRLSVGLRGAAAPRGLNKSMMVPYIGGWGRPGIPPGGGDGGGIPPAGGIPGTGAAAIALPSGVAPPA